MVRQSESPGYALSEVQNGTVILPATYSWLNNSASNQSDTRPTYAANDSDYNSIRKYDISPILLTNPSVLTADKFGQVVSLSPFQSTQNKNQFIYSRFKDVSSEDIFYNYINPDDDFTFNLDTCENFYTRNSLATSPSTADFIWGGGFNADGTPTKAASYAVDDQSIEVHITHPAISSYTAYRNAYINLTNDTVTLPASIAAPINCISTARVLFRHSKFIPLVSDQVKGKQQAIYLNENYISLLFIFIYSFYFSRKTKYY
jgi:hypothetical protein